MWIAAPSPTLAARLDALFAVVVTLEVPVARGEPDVVILGVGPTR